MRKNSAVYEISYMQNILLKVMEEGTAKSNIVVNMLLRRKF
jgi:hypothetical protein